MTRPQPKAPDEVRTMQFVIERQCPSVKSELYGLPIVVWVNLESKTKHKYRCGSKSVFAITGDSDLEPADGYGPGLISVCEHMGRLIE